MEHVVVVGGGIGGLAAARGLVLAGKQVTVLEAAPTVGGLVQGFEVQGQPLERYYHYVLPQEGDILRLIDQLGLSSRVGWFPGSIGILDGGRVWPFTSPVDLLRFAPLSPVDRIRAGVGALRLGRVSDWEHLDTIPARQWLSQLTSPAVTEVVWDPLLRAKFGPAAGQVPAAWMWGRLDQRRRARKGAGEVIGYMQGGFGQLFRALADDLTSRGADVRTSAPARQIFLEGDRVAGVEVEGDVIGADAVLFAGTLPKLTSLLPEELWDDRWRTARGLGALCAVLVLPRALTNIFWTNVCDKTVPFGGIIEHTNLAPPEWYGGHHVVYLSRYFAADEAVATSDTDTEVKQWLSSLESLFPSFSAGDVISVDAFRTPYAAPLVTTPYLPHIPPVTSHVAGLYVMTTAQIYPQDRGMDEGVRRAGLAVATMTR
jgi:protoporphyrinogen oxidase